jgi:prevent-host-death family protein
MELSTKEFKSKCIELMEMVKTNHEEVVITQFGKPIAKLVPIEEKKPVTLFGFMKNSVIINDDIISPIDDEWDVER